MRRTRIYLSEAERQGLLALAQRSGLRQARGLWASRDDLPDWRELRQELDRPRP